MAKTNKKTQGISLIEFLNKATSYQTVSANMAKQEIEEIKKQARKLGWEKKFSQLIAQDPDWVEKAMKAVKYEITRNGKVKGVFPRIKNGCAILKVVM